MDVWFGRDCICSNIERLSNIDEMLFLKDLLNERIAQGDSYDPHDFNCKATCSNGYISGAFSRGETCSNQDLTGFIDSDQNSIMFLFGDSTSQGSKEKWT